MGSRTVTATTEIKDLVPDLSDEDFASLGAGLPKIAFWFAGIRFVVDGGPMGVVVIAVAEVLVVGVDVPAFFGSKAVNCFDVDGPSSLKLIEILETYLLIFIMAFERFLKIIWTTSYLDFCKFNINHSD